METISARQAISWIWRQTTTLNNRWSSVREQCQKKGGKEMEKGCLIKNSLRLLETLVLSTLIAIFLGACSGGGGDGGGGGEGDIEAPTTPTGLAATAVSSSQITLSWNVSTDNVGVAGYRIYRNGSLLASKNFSFTMDSPLAYEKAIENDTDDVATGYEVYGGDGNLVAYVEIAPVEETAQTDISFGAITDTKYSDTGLKENAQYCYAVSAADAAGNESGRSSQACATTPEDKPCEGGGLPLSVSDLDFPSTVTRGSFVLGSVAYKGSFNDIINPVMAYRVYTGEATITTYLLSAKPTTNNCRIIFTVSIPDDVSGTGTSYFKLVDFVSGDSNWDDNGVSNVVSKTVTIN
jgi:chitodextrinase